MSDNDKPMTRLAEALQQRITRASDTLRALRNGIQDGTVGGDIDWLDLARIESALATGETACRQLRRCEKEPEKASARDPMGDQFRFQLEGKLMLAIESLHEVERCHAREFADAHRCIGRAQQCVATDDIDGARYWLGHASQAERAATGRTECTALATALLTESRARGPQRAAAWDSVACTVCDADATDCTHFGEDGEPLCDECACELGLVVL